MERNVLEYVDHLHEHFVTPCSINDKGRYNVPNNPNEGYRYVNTLLVTAIKILTFPVPSIEMREKSIAEYEWPNGTYWTQRRGV